MRDYLLPAVSNGNPQEQRLIRRWWQQCEQGAGSIVWEYYFSGSYADALWFRETADEEENDGKNAPRRCPIAEREVTLCEAKLRLIPELIG